MISGQLGGQDLVGPSERCGRVFVASGTCQCPSQREVEATGVRCRLVAIKGQLDLQRALETVDGRQRIPDGQ